LEPGTENYISGHYAETPEELEAARAQGEWPVSRFFQGNLRVLTPDHAQITNIYFVDEKDVQGHWVKRSKEELFADLHNEGITEWGKRWELDNGMRLAWDPTLPSQARK
jgi:hypothetical protein